MENITNSKYYRTFGLPRLLREILPLFRHLLWPSSCVFCGALGEICCVSCLDACFSRFGGVLSPGDTSSSLEIAYGSPHGGELRDLVHRLKYRHEATVGKILGEALGRRFRSLFRGAIFVPLPLHTKSSRSYNQALLLAQGVARACDGSVWDCLYWKEEAAPQTGKSRKERQSLSSDALVFFGDSRKPRENPNAPLVLVDDVTTTGTTLKVAAEVLEKEGYEASRGVVCCYAPSGGMVL